MQQKVAQDLVLNLPNYQHAWNKLAGETSTSNCQLGVPMQILEPQFKIEKLGEHKCVLKYLHYVNNNL